MTTSTREQIAWLYRRVGFGLGPGELDELEALGTDRVLERLVDPERSGVAAAADPWAGVDLTPPEELGKVDFTQAVATVAAWLRAMVTTPRPLHEWMRWFWHGHFVSTLPVVKSPMLLVEQVQMLGSLGLGGFRELLRAVSTDPAMLIYLDGRKNQRGEINENYGREVLELFSLGVGNYSEDDVRAGSVALSGWVVSRGDRDAVLVPRRHDPTPQRFLGVSDVDDVDGVVDAIVDHEACAPFITGKLGRAILGSGLDTGLIERLAADFADSELDLTSLVRALLEEGLDGAGGEVVQAPVPWLACAIRAAGVDPETVTSAARESLPSAGQVPFNAPNVAGWPGGTAWLGSSATVARFNLAMAIASQAGASNQPSQMLDAAAEGDLASLADLLLRPAGFSDATRSALGDVIDGTDDGGVTTSAIALASPDLVVI